MLEPSLGSEQPKRAKMSPKEPSGASKNQNRHFQKPEKTIGFLKVFGYRGFSRKPQEAQDGSQKTPEKSKTPKIGIQSWSQKIIKKIGTNFWTHSKTQAQLKKSKTESILETPFPRISGIQIMPRQKVNERGKKTMVTGIILYKRKGGIRTWVARVKECHY